MSTSHGARLYAQLRNMRDDAGQLLYQRLCIANQILSDEEWVNSLSGGGGSRGVALDRIESDCFGELCGAMTLAQLLEILHHIPNAEVWKKNKFNLKKLWLQMKETQKEAKRSEEVEDTATSSSDHRAVEFKAPSGPGIAVDLDTPQDEIAVLRKENAELKRELAALKHRNKRLETIIRRMKKLLPDTSKVA